MQMLAIDDINDRIDAFLRANSCEAIEAAADRLGDIANPSVLDALLYRLGDAPVQEDPDVEDAVCSALVSLGVMHRLGNRNFRFVFRDELDPAPAELVYEKYRQLCPSCYYR